MRKFKFDNYVLGLICLLVVCVLPAISPIVYFLSKNDGIMPYLLILVAIAGILYEFPPNKNAEDIIKIEQVIISVWSFIFLAIDLALFTIRADSKDYTYFFLDYSLLGYVLAPFVVTIIETIRSAKEYFRSDSNNNRDNNVIAVGNASNV